MQGRSRTLFASWTGMVVNSGSATSDCKLDAKLQKLSLTAELLKDNIVL